MADNLSIKVSAEVGDASRALLGLKSDSDTAFTGVAQASGSAASHLQQDSVQIGSSLSKVGQDFNDVETKAKSSLSGISSSLSDLKGKVASFSLGTLGGATFGADLAGGMETANVTAGQLQAKLGLTREEAEALAGVSRQAFRQGFTDDIGAANEVVAGLSRGLGLVGDDLINSTNLVLKMTSTFEAQGASTDTIMESLRSMKSAYPDKSTVELLSMITDGFQGAAGTSGDLQDTLKEYPSAFASIGLSGTDMMNWMNSGMSNGAFNTDKLGDAVKEFAIRVKTDGDTAQLAIQKMFPKEQADQLIKDFQSGGEAGRQAFFTVMEQMNNTTDAGEKYNLMTMLFGSAGEDLSSQVLDKMVPAFTASKDAQLDSEQTLKSLDGQYVGFRHTLEVAKRTIVDSMINPLGSVAAPAQEAAMSIGGVGTALLGFKGFGGSALGVLGGLKSAIVAVSSPTKIFTAIQAGLNIVMAANPFVLVALALVGLGAALVVAYQKSETFREIVNAAFEQVKKIVSGVVDYFQKTIMPFFTEDIPRDWEDLKRQTKLAWTTFKDDVVGAAKALKDGVTKPIRELITFIDDRWEQLKSDANSAWRWLRDVLIGTHVVGLVSDVKSNIQDMKNWLFSTWEGAKTDANNAWTWLKTTASTKFSELKTTILNPINEAKATLDGVWDAISRKVDEAWTGIKRRIDDMNPSIANALKWPFEFARDVIGGIMTNFKNNLAFGWNAAARGINGFIVGVANAVNWVGNKLTGHDLISWSGLVSIPQFERGGVHQGGLMIAGEKGAELAVAPKGTHVFNKQETIDIFKAVNQRDPEGSPLGQFGPLGRGGLSEAYAAVKNFGVSAISSARELMGKGANWLLNTGMTTLGVSLDLPGVLKDMGVGMFAKVKDAALQFIQKFLDKLSELMPETGAGGYPGGNKVLDMAYRTPGRYMWCEQFIGDVMQQLGLRYSRMPSAVSHAFMQPLNPGYGPVGAITYFPDNPYGHVAFSGGNGWIYGTMNNKDGKGWMNASGWKPYGWTINPYERGGIIPEPVLGMGLRSLQMYSFAEKRPERVSQLGERGGGQSLSVNFTGDITINARNQAEADQSMKFVGNSLKTVLRRQGHR